MPVSELNKIERSVFIRAPRARVWRALTDSREFGAWFGVETTKPFLPGVRIEVTCTLESAPCTDQSPKGIVMYMEIEQMIAEEFFSWRWHPGMPRPEVDYSKEPTTLVGFRLQDAAGGTRLTVTESGFDQISLTRRAAVFGENEAGWAHQMKAVSDYVSQTP